jgi:hypothetical protein
MHHNKKPSQLRSMMRGNKFATNAYNNSTGKIGIYETHQCGMMQNRGLGNTNGTI